MSVPFDGGLIDFTLGRGSTPDVVVTDQEGIVAKVGNPFGEHAWLCGVATTDTRVLGVGSAVWWSDDGITWIGIEAFEQYAGWNDDGSNLMWAAAGPGGYMVLGRAELGHRFGWFSEDLESWHEIPLDGPEYSSWALVGPYRADVGAEPIIEMFDGAWIGTRPAG